MPLCQICNLYLYRVVLIFSQDFQMFHTLKYLAEYLSPILLLPGLCRFLKASVHIYEKNSYIHF